MALHPSHRPPPGERGFTLIEVMFATVMIVIVMGVALNLMASVTNNYYQDTGRNDATGMLRRAAGYMNKDLCNGSQIVGSFGSYTTTGNTIVIAAPSYNSSGVISGSSDYIIYTLSDADLLQRTTYAAAGSLRQGETNRTMSRQISSIAFAYIVHDFSTGDGVTTTFPLSTDWLGTPVCRLDGASYSGVSYKASKMTATLSAAPATGQVVEFVYPVDPSVAANLANVSEVDVTLQASSSSGTDGTLQMTVNSRLRNKL